MKSFTIMSMIFITLSHQIPPFTVSERNNNKEREHRSVPSLPWAMGEMKEKEEEEENGLIHQRTGQSEKREKKKKPDERGLKIMRKREEQRTRK